MPQALVVTIGRHGHDINKTNSGETDYQAFGARLEDNLDSLQQLLAQPGFGEGPASLGSELELYIVDAAGSPLYDNVDILADA